jgi:hypothetical protein
VAARVIGVHGVGVVPREAAWLAGAILEGDQPDGHPYNNREFAVQLHGGSVQLSSTPVSRLHRGHLFLDTPRGAVQVDRWHHGGSTVQ